MRKKKTKQEIAAILENNNLYDWDGEYINSTTPLICKCRVCNGDCCPRYDDLHRGRGGCVACGHKKTAAKKKPSTTTIIDLLNQKNLCAWDGIYINNSVPLNCKCRICNNDCHPTFSGIRINKGGCQVCARNKKYTTNEVERLLNEKYLYNWDGVYINNQTPLNCKCKICDSDCHPRIGILQQGGGGCSKCGNKNGAEKQKTTIKEIEICLDKKDLYCWDRDYVNANTPLKCKCKICNSDCFPRLGDLQSGAGGCRACAVLKAAKTMNKATILYNWETGAECICVGSFEVKTVEFWNSNRERFLWHPPLFKMLDERTYTIDAYLIDRSIYIEIKGYFWKDALEKWKWFHKEYPNSELWDKDKLKEMGIIKE